ncbi:hypothetical protein M2152_000198 [Microbacteriaceae bacterium SG_E_30_P1]|uniref:Uncharacterized protein n=1 Tax=Antiquaquibacter oligotrophicus TaxID=2880260 RepID=A0ABT6KJD9_9MICO|nr:hypothetical protein [Antiquaquibacter oligotrophicus]
MRFSWGRLWLALASIAAVALAVGFALQYLGLWVTA